MFGDEAVVPTLLYFFANTTYFWTMGNFLEAMDGVEATHAKCPKLLSKETVRRVFSPPLVGFLAAIAFILADVLVPGAILSAAQYLGGITTHLALIFNGIMIYTIWIRNVRFDKDLTLVFLGRFEICPLVCLGLTQVFGLSPPLHERLRNPDVSSLHHADCSACKVPSRRHEVRHDRRGGDDARIRRDFAGVDDDSYSTRLSIAKQNGLETVICTKKVKFFL